MAISINLPAVKRIPGDFDTFQQAFESVGFERVSSAANERVYYHENEIGMGVTLIDGPRANIAMPSGPIRGGLFSPATTGFGIMGGDSPLKQAMEEAERSMSVGEGSESNTKGSTGDREFTV